MKQLLLWVGITVLMAACSTSKLAVQANNDFFLGKNFNQTYQVIINQGESILSTQAQDAITEEIDRQMQARGFRKTTEMPDIVIIFSAYHNKVKLKDSRKLDEAPNAEWTTRKMTLKGGTLMIQMIDENLNKPVWLGTASGFLSREVALEERMAKAITRSIFDEYRGVAYGYLQ